jgi:hypothetical protein
MVGTPTGRQAVYYFADYEESEYRRQRITRKHVTVLETVPTKRMCDVSDVNFKCTRKCTNRLQ